MLSSKTSYWYILYRHKYKVISCQGAHMPLISLAGSDGHTGVAGGEAPLRSRSGRGVADVGSQLRGGRSSERASRLNLSCGIQISSMARRIPPLFLPITLIFLRSPCSTFKTSNTQKTRLVYVALQRRRRTLPANIQSFPKFRLPVLAILTPIRPSSPQPLGFFTREPLQRSLESVYYVVILSLHSISVSRFTVKTGIHVTVC